MQDVARSKLFMSGIYQAICDVFERRDEGGDRGHEEVHILYAGTGPYGLLLVPILPLFAEKNIHVTLLEPSFIIPMAKIVI